MNKNIFFIFLIILTNSVISATTFQPLIIGLGGGVGSGKSTIARMLKEKFPEVSEIVTLDDFPAFNYQQMTDEQRETYDFDHPKSYDHERFAATINTLIEGKPVQCPNWSFCNPTRPAGTFWQPKPILILEGFHLFYSPIILELFRKNVWNLACFVTVSNEEERIQRIILRNLKDRNESEENSRRRYASHIKPAYDEHIKPTERYAHATFHNNDQASLNQAIEILSDRIEKFLKNVKV